MRSRIGWGLNGLAAGLALSAMTPSAADDVFMCQDGRRLLVTNENRKQLADDPCIKQWFASSQAQREAARLKKAAKFAEPAKPKSEAPEEPATAPPTPPQMVQPQAPIGR